MEPNDLQIIIFTKTRHVYICVSGCLAHFKALFGSLVLLEMCNELGFQTESMLLLLLAIIVTNPSACSNNLMGLF